MNTPVSFELAKLLKENEFDKITNFSYNSVGMISSISNRNSDGLFISAPTIAEACMWLHEKHGIWIEAPFWDYKFRIKIINTIEEKVLRGIDFEGYNLPTEAYLSAIKYTLEKII